MQNQNWWQSWLAKETETQWKKKSHPSTIHPSTHPSIHPSRYNWWVLVRAGDEMKRGKCPNNRYRQGSKWVSPCGTVKLVVSFIRRVLYLNTVCSLPASRNLYCVPLYLPLPLPFLPAQSTSCCDSSHELYWALLAYQRQRHKDINFVFRFIREYSSFKGFWLDPPR
jgi:hypothetical protein